MKVGQLLFFLLIPLGMLQAQESRWHLPKPEGWNSEEFSLPPAFAPSIRYTGIETLRFAPGWADSTAESYWSYVFGWQVKGSITTRADSLRRQLIAYYNGLYLANRQHSPAGYGPEFTQVRVTPEPTPWPQDQASFTGKAYTYNYLTGRQIDILFKIHRRTSPDGRQTLLLFEASPKPYGHATWRILHAIAEGAHFDTKP